VSRFGSSTRKIPETLSVPRHIAIIMDGNGRWARKRLLPRVAGHRKGLESVRSMVKCCAELGVDYLTLFAFSSENWRRPMEEVTLLMQLFMTALEREVAKLHENNVRLVVVGDMDAFNPKLVRMIRSAEALTRNNTKLTLTIAANYGGRWDILQAMHAMLRNAPDIAADFTEEDLRPYLSMHYAPEPDLFIRTGGEQRISNFLLWQLAYTELYFTPTLWPDFNRTALNKAIQSYHQRERRFGRTSEQLQSDA